MAECKECLHYYVCKKIHFPSLFGLTGDGCDHFKNKDYLVEVGTGEWIEADNTGHGHKFVCSSCKGIVYYQQPTRDKNWVKHCGYSYCPHCLAKMDRKEKKNDELH